MPQLGNKSNGNSNKHDRGRPSTTIKKRNNKTSVPGRTTGSGPYTPPPKKQEKR